MSTLHLRDMPRSLVLLSLLVLLGLAMPQSIESPSRRRRLPWLSDGLKEGLSSALATSVVKAVLQPLDTIKTVQQGIPGKHLGPLDAASQVLRTRGITGFWSGLGVTIFGSAPSAAVYFGSYASIKKRLLRVMPADLKLLTYALSACVGNTFASFFRVPYEVIKQRMQMGQFDSAWTAIVDCWTNEGVVGLFGQGKLVSQIVRDVPYAVATLVTYELLQSSARQYLSSLQMNNEPPTVVQQREKLVNAACGSAAGGFGSFVTNPMDVIKTRMMTSRRYPDVPTAACRILKEEGPGAFMIGVSSRLLHKVPANGLFFLCYEWFRKALDIQRL